MVKAHTEEFRCHVIAVIRRGEKSVRQVAKTSESPRLLVRWLRFADRDNGVESFTAPSAEAVEHARPREPQKRLRLLEQENEVLRRAAVAYLVLGFSKQAFSRCHAIPVTDRDWADAQLTNDVIDAHREDTTFGYRFIADDLQSAGHRASEQRVWRLCSQQRLRSLHAKKRGLNRKAEPPAHDGRVRRAFTAPDLDRLWLADITEHSTRGGQALHVRGQGRVVSPDRRPFDQRCGPHSPSRLCRWWCAVSTQQGR
ncbi:IS3 family transposase [Curtobacterium sp. VKM Ac-2852]|uniref:IS3 family transposase n=1 Tax=Curtobacterium sp. VKM Ac-2852 TaxID=2739024 RepID=UPI001565CD0C|nr:transposase [Curtobacterium sp. VKM Ac-2852]